MGKVGKRRFFACNIRLFYPIHKNTPRKKILDRIVPTDFSSADPNILKSRVFDPNLKKKINFSKHIQLITRTDFQLECAAENF